MMSSSNLCICRIPADWSFMNTVTQKLTRLKIFTAVSFILTAALGTACHFAFDFFGQSRLIAPFVPVNESTWEHLKLLFFPFLLLLVIGCFAGIAGGNAPISNRSLKKMFLSCYWDGAAFGELCGMAAVVVLFYGINGILGFNLDWVFVTFLFMLFTFYPPHIGLFSDPQNGSYGLSASLFTRYSYPSRMTALWSEASRVVCSIV